MVCNKCGMECADDAKFCTNCGTELTAEESVQAEAEETAAAVTEDGEMEAAGEPEAAEAGPAEETAEEPAQAAEVPVQEQKEEKEEKKEEKKAPAEVKEKKAEKEKKPANKNIIKAVGVVAALLLLFLLFRGCFSKGKDYIVPGKNAVIAIDETEDLVLAVMGNGKALDTEMEEADYAAYSQDRSVACFVNEDDALVVIRKGKVVKTGIEDTRRFQISTYGDTIAYFTDVSGDFGTLNLYYTKNGKKKEIAEEVLIDSVVLSPDGETVAFVGDYEARDDFKGYYSIGGKKPVEVGKEKRVFAIADKAAYLYYVDDDRIYAKKKKKDAEKLASGIYYVSALVNEDCTELLFLNDGKTYLSVKAGEKKKVSNDELEKLVLPAEALQVTKTQNMARGSIRVTFTGADTFEEQVFSAGTRLVYLDKKHEGNAIAAAVRQCIIAENRENLVYVNVMGDVIRVEDFDKGGKETQVGDEDAEAQYLYADGSLKYVYYINEDDELYCIKGKKGKKIADDVTSAAISQDGTTCYYVVEEEDLFYSKKAGKGKKIAASEDGTNCVRYFNTVLVSLREDDEVSISIIDGKKLKELYKSYYD